MSLNSAHRTVRQIGILLLLPVLTGMEAHAGLSVQAFTKTDGRDVPKLVWLWKTGPVTKEGINLDLEAVASAGVNELSLRLDPEAGLIPDSLARRKELLQHANRQADRLGVILRIDSSASKNTDVFTLPLAGNPAFLVGSCIEAFRWGNRALELGTFVHQPGLDAPARCSDSLFDRNDPRFTKASYWMPALTRMAFMLRQVLPVADIALLTDGKSTTSGNSALEGLSVQISPNDLLKADFRKGRLVLPDGRMFRVLVLPQKQKLSLDLLRAIGEGLENGLSVVADKPEAPEGTLKASEQTEWNARVRELWADLPAGTYRYGAGRLYHHVPDSAWMTKEDIRPSFLPIGPSRHRSIRSVALSDGSDAVWLLANKSMHSDTLLAGFNIRGMQPTWWDPETGEVRTLPVYRQMDDQTLVPLVLEPGQTGFVVFKEKMKGPSSVEWIKDEHPLWSADPMCFSGVQDSLPVRDEILPVFLEVKDAFMVRRKGAYSVRKPEAPASKPSVLLLKKDLPLYAWSMPDSSSILREHTGSDLSVVTSTWTKTFILTDKERAGNRWLLSLGSSADWADVSLNGKSMGFLWHAPYRIEITHGLKSGENVLEIKLTDLPDTHTPFPGGKECSVIVSAWKAVTE